jgi:hypothetical protein
MPGEATSRRGEYKHNLGEFQPRNRREQMLIEHVLMHADEIRAERRQCAAWAVAISGRDSEGKQARESPTPGRAPQLEDLLARLSKLDDSPSNEAARFQLLTEIYRIENSVDESDILSAEFIDG